jgi:hypothetical protein
MTSPRHSEATALGRFYTRPGSGEKLISVTNALSTAMAKPALVPWAAKIVAEYTLDHLPQIVARSRTDRDGVLQHLKSQVTVARDKAADLGSRIHALAEAHATGQQVAWQDGDDECAPYVDQYVRFLTDFDVDLQRDVIAAEMTVADPHLGVAGTLDLIVMLPIGVEHTGKGLTFYQLPDGERHAFLIDLKTSATRPSTSVYGEYALQLAALRDMSEAWMPDGSIEPMPRVSGCAVLNLRRSAYALIPLPFTDAERKAWRGVVTVAKWSHSTGKDINGGEYRPVTPAGASKPKQTRKTSDLPKAG